MALIGTLRNKMGTLLVVFVFAAIAAFTLNDLLGNNSVLLGGGNHVGEIGSHTISLEEYQNAVRQQEMNYQLYFNRNPSERDQPLIQNQAWELLVAKHAIEPQYEKLGIKVTTEELEDMLYGKHVNESIKSTPIFLTEAGQFDPNKVVSYLQELSKRPETSEDRFRWEQFQQNLRPGRIRIKYENLMIKTGYITSAEAEREYHVQNDVAEIKYLYVPYYSISDSAAKIADADLKDYYNRNKEKFKTELTADVSFVSFPVEASHDDTVAIRQELQQLAEEFRTATNDSLFAIINSEASNPFERYTPNNLPPYVSADSLVEGKVFGPFLDGNTYKVVKVSSLGSDTVYSARARHILVKWTDDSNKPEAKAKAEGILKELKAGADFATKAREVSEDPGSGQSGGDLGWFSSGQMVKPFESAVFNANKTGLVNTVVESEFGYHIIDVTNTKDNTAYWIGTLETEITAGDASINTAARKAESFQSSVSSVSEFENRAKEENLQILYGKDIKSADRRVGILSDARRVAQWMFRDASVGKVSEVFDLQDEYVVAVMTEKIEKGYKPLDKVKEEMTPAVRDEVKSKLITEKLAKLTGTLEEIAQAYGPDAAVRNLNDLHMTSSSLPSVGVDPEVIGLIFSLEGGKRTAPYGGESGVVIIEMQNKTVAPAVADYGQYKNQLEQSLSSQTSFNITEAIKENSGIEDDRYKFY